MRKKNLDFMGNKLILDEKTKKTKIFRMEDLDPANICNNIKELSKYYEDKIKQLEKENVKLKSDKKYKELEDEVKELNNKLFKNSLVYLSDTQVKKIKEFKDKHYNKCAKADNEKLIKQGIHPATGFSKGNTYIYEITGTSIGEIIKIKCPICGEELDITEL